MPEHASAKFYAGIFKTYSTQENKYPIRCSAACQAKEKDNVLALITSTVLGSDEFVILHKHSSYEDITRPGDILRITDYHSTFLWPEFRPWHHGRTRMV